MGSLVIMVKSNESHGHMFCTKNEVNCLSVLERDIVIYVFGWGGGGGGSVLYVSFLMCVRIGTAMECGAFSLRR